MNSRAAGEIRPRGQRGWFLLISDWVIRVPARARGRAAEPARDLRAHIGRLWASGEPFLASGAAVRSAWHGFSNDDYDQVVSREDTSVPAGTGRALLADADGVIRDDSCCPAHTEMGGTTERLQAG